MPSISIDVDLDEFCDSDILEAADEIRAIAFEERQGGLAGMEDRLLLILKPLSDNLRKEGKLSCALEVEEIMEACR